MIKAKNRAKRKPREREVLQWGKPTPKSRPVREERSHGSRIPNVYVGQVVNTSVGPKKKVFPGIERRILFRMVDPNWKAQEVQKQRANRDQ